MALTETPLCDFGAPAPDFTLPRLEQVDQNISPKDMLGHVWLLNVWATYHKAQSVRRVHRRIN